MNQMVHAKPLAQVIYLPNRIFSTPVSHQKRSGGGMFGGIEKLTRNIAADMASTKTTRIGELFNVNITSEFGVAAALEARRLSEKYGKDYLNCEDLVSIMGIGKNNARQLLNAADFPTVEVGNRKVVSVIAFALWSLRDSDRYM